MLGDALDDAALGRLTSVIVQGEACIGKSRLLSEVLAMARDQGFQVASGRAKELERTRPFGLLVDAFDCSTSSPDPRRAGIAELLASHVGARGPVTVTSDPGLQFQVVDKFVDLIEELALQRPLVLGVDDLQWADPSSLSTLDALSRRLTYVPVALIGCMPDLSLTGLNDYCPDVPAMPLVARSLGFPLPSFPKKETSRTMPTELMAALQTLERALAKVKRSTLLARLQPGLEPIATRALLAEQGFSPRSDVEDLFSWHNGTMTEGTVTLNELYLFPWMYFPSLGEALELMDLLDPPRTPSPALPLFTTGGGGMLILDWIRGVLVDFNHDDPEPPASYLSLQSFVDTVNASYAAGAYYVDSDGQLNWDREKKWSIGRELNPGLDYWRPH